MKKIKMIIVMLSVAILFGCGDAVDRDLREAKKVIENHLEALSDGDKDKFYENITAGLGVPANYFENIKSISVEEIVEDAEFSDGYKFCKLDSADESTYLFLKVTYDLKLDDDENISHFSYKVSGTYEGHYFLYKQVDSSEWSLCSESEAQLVD